MFLRAYRTPVNACVVLALMLFAAACSSDNSGNDSAATTTAKSAKPNLALLGPENKAAGTPLEIGYIHDGQSQGIDARAEVTTARATVKYVNEHLDGVAGRPLELLECATNVTPAGATDCANQMIAAKVPVVLSAAPSQPAVIVKAFEDANIPYFAYAGADQSLLLSADTSVLANALGSVAVPVKVAEDNKVKKVAMVLIDVPAAVGPVKSISTPVFDAAGISVSYTAVAPGTPDMTPQIQGALSEGAQQFSVIGDATFCISALRALKTLGFEGDIVINSQCTGPNVASSVPGGIDGVMIATNESLDPKDAEVQLYEAVMAKYAPDTPPHQSGNSGAYAAALGFARAMTGVTGDVTAERVQQALVSMSPQPLPLLAGQTFKCDRTAVALTPSVCSTGTVILTVDADGNVKHSEAFDPTPYLKLD